MPTDTIKIKWIEINWKVLDTINDNRSIIWSTEVVNSLDQHHTFQNTEDKFKKAYLHFHVGAAFGTLLVVMVLSSLSLAMVLEERYQQAPPCYLMSFVITLL
jgi:hypothetical protein